ncbi:MAG: hypothetical protein FJ320_11310 [SAR202 cluster bacterium]|nr:hypothetical protein [SAR202 cluster bacterium]
MDATLFLIGANSALAVALLTALLYQGFTYRRRVLAARFGPAPEAAEARTGPLLRKRRPESPLLVRLLPLSAPSQDRMALELERAGWRVRAGEYLAFRVACTAAFMLAGLLLVAVVDVKQSVLRILAVVFLSIAGWLLPRILLGRSLRKRLEQVEKQLPDAMTAMAKSLKAGAGLYQAIAFAAKETPSPLGPELQRTLRDLNLGAEADDAFEALSERIGSPDLNIALTAISIQRMVGGNLSEILMNVTNTVRERAKIKAEVRVLTSKQKMMSNLMALLPVVVALAFIAVNPDMGSLLFNTTAGQIALAAGITLELIGLWLIRRLAIIEV